MKHSYCVPNDGNEDMDWEESLEMHAATQRKRMKQQKALLDSLILSTRDAAEEQPPGNPPRPREKRRYKRRSAMFDIDSQGEVIELTPKSTPWYKNYILIPKFRPHEGRQKKIFEKNFRRRFRLPYQQFIELVEICRGHDDFRRWTQPDALGVQPSPLELMVLGSLRYLGRGWTFDDIAEATSIDEETHRQFFHVFIGFGSTALFQRWVVAPKNAADARNPEYLAAGLPGCVGSMDVTHVLCEKISHLMRQNHLAYKLNGTARTYNIVVNHRRMILSTTRGHPARWNDKTLVKFDGFAVAIRKGSTLDDVEFILLEWSGDKIVERKYRGAWILVDNGYLQWSCTVPPIKSSSSEAEIIFSQWLESMRKDVECTFGILKGRFRILKAGIRLHGVQAADKIWATCCALHNWLLDVDGLDEPWEKELGQWDIDEDAIPNFAMRRLEEGANDPREYDAGGTGRGDDFVGDDDDPEVQVDIDHRPQAEQLASCEDEEGVRCVRELSLDVFRSKLIENFMILRHQKKVAWPQCKSA